MISDQAEFVRYMNESLPEQPPNMARIVKLNMSFERPEEAEAHQLAVVEVAGQQAAGAHLLDVRSTADFGAGHIPGAVSVHLDGGQFQNRVGLVFPPGARLVLVTSTDLEAHRTVDALSVIGFTNIAGYITGGMPRWEQSGFDYESTPGISVQELNERIESDPALQVLDVREQSEWQEGHIADATSVPFHKVRAAAGSLDPNRLSAVICGSGTRSMIAASILQALGFKSVFNVEGGMGAWNAAHLPIVAEHEPAEMTAS
jgi:hydroxyacylglutathione hydrolase